MTAAPGRRMLAALIMAVLSYALLQTLVVPALGLLQHSLHTSRTWSAWILSAFLLSSAVLTPLISRLGDRRDKRQVMLGVLAAYFVGAAGAALAQNIGELIAARIVQGAGLSLLPLSVALIRETLPASRARAAMGTVSAVIGAGAGAGLVIGGLLADSLSWRYLFITGAALIAVSFAMAAAWIPAAPAASTLRGGRDPAGACLLALGLSALLLALTEGPAWGWTSPRVLALFAAAAVLLAALAAAEARTPDPLVDITEFTRPPALTTHLAALVFGALSYIFYVALPAYAETPRALAGYGLTASVTQAGLIMLPGALTLLAAGALVGPAAARLGPRWPAAAGFTLSTTGTALFALAHAQAWQDVVFYALVGAGSGLIIATLPILIADIVPAQRTGIANGINNIMRTVGGVIGAQVTAAALTSGTITHLPPPPPTGPSSGQPPPPAPSASCYRHSPPEPGSQHSHPQPASPRSHSPRQTSARYLPYSQLLHAYPSDDPISRAGPVPRDVHAHRPDPGLHILTDPPVAGVPGITARHFAPFIAQVRGQLGIQQPVIHQLAQRDRIPPRIGDFPRCNERCPPKPLPDPAASPPGHVIGA